MFDFDPKAVKVVGRLDSGPSARLLEQSGTDPGVLRPYYRNGVPVICRNAAGPEYNGGPAREVAVRDLNPQLQQTLNAATTTLDADDLRLVDDTAREAARPALRLWADLEAAGCGMTIPNGYAVLSLKNRVKTMEASTVTDMFGMGRSDRSRPTFDSVNWPCPITYTDISWPDRELAAMRRAGIPLDTDGVAAGSRAIMETVESMVLGTWGSFTYDGGTMYGYTNFPGRNTGSIRNPSAYPGWTPHMTVLDMLAGLQVLRLLEFKGPFRWYFGRSWLPYFGDDYAASYGGETLSSRIAKIPELGTVSISDNLSGFQVLLINMTPDVVQACTGMPLSPLQWIGEGGMARYWKLMTIMFPRIRVDARGRCGILHLSAISS